LKPKPKPPPNLLDSPFDIPLPVTTSNLPAPPIPRNPEKDALLSTLSTTLTQNLHAAIAQNTSALPHLQSQHLALTSAQQSLSSELDALTNLSTTLSSNISILQSALHSSNAAIAAAQSRAAKGDIPNVDEMLTAPTVVGKQLYDVVCEERGIEAGIWALQEGFARGRISLEVWARKTRELSREGFRRRWLAGKIGRGMGLEA
jgi:ESCRT-I complex subunit TSG101